MKPVLLFIGLSASSVLTARVNTPDSYQSTPDPDKPVGISQPGPADLRFYPAEALAALAAGPSSKRGGRPRCFLLARGLR
jgi:hypothetical protein